MRDNRNQKLLQIVKKYLVIDDEDSDTDDLLIEYIEGGKKYLDDIAGCKLDYYSFGLPRSLLLDYCRYARSQALEVFGQNYAGELLKLNLQQYDSYDGGDPDEN